MSDALSIDHLQKTYSTGVQALKGVSLHVPEGDFFGLLGPNGAGKTTLISIVTGLALKTSGDVKVCGYDHVTEASRAKSMIGLVPQEFNFNIFERVREIVVNQAGYYGIPREKAREHTDTLLHKLGLFEKRDAFSRTLSGGMKRRLMIARALVHQPKILILDEPTAGVDIELRRGMWDFLRELNDSGVTIILTTHYLEEAEQLCRNLAIIHGGEIVRQGALKDLLGELHMETFLFDTHNDISGIPLDSVADLDARRIDGHTLEISAPQGSIINDIIAKLTTLGIEIRSMRNKSNRLEEIFLRLTDTHPKHL
jgi:ABC-2 type transport system ATP-binding protein